MLLHTGSVGRDGLARRFMEFKMVLIQEAIPSRREVTRRALAAWSANTSFKSSSRPDVTWREVLDFQPASPLQFDAKEFAMCPREAVWLWARTLACINKTLHACLDDEVVPSVIHRQRRFRQTVDGGSSAHGGQHDSIARTRRWGQRNRN